MAVRPTERIRRHRSYKFISYSLRAYIHLFVSGTKRRTVDRKHDRHDLVAITLLTCLFASKRLHGYKHWTGALYLGEAFHVTLDDFRVRTFELLDDVETLVELSEHISDRTREQSMLGRLLELHTNISQHIGHLLPVWRRFHLHCFHIIYYAEYLTNAALVRLLGRQAK